MKIILENETIKVSETGRDYDFIATIENKTNNDIVIQPTDYNLEFYETHISANDWIGLLANENGWITLEAIKIGLFEIS